MKTQYTNYPWAVIGAGPAGIASVGLLLEAGVDPKSIIWIDPAFAVGDFGHYWGEVYSNTTVATFLTFLRSIQGFAFHYHPHVFSIEQRDPEGYCQLKDVTQPLAWITQQLRQGVTSLQDHVEMLHVEDGCWQLTCDQANVSAEKVILATGSDPKTLFYEGIETISLYDALKPEQLAKKIHANDRIAVFGSSHSSMIIMKNLLDLGVNDIVNFYLTPHRYAVPMDGWTLYDNTGLKAATAEWTREHISKQLHPAITRYVSTPEIVQAYLPSCQKAIYPVGFKARAPYIKDIDIAHYDKSTGIIAPGVFGAGIAFPRQKTDPLGGQELRVGLFKFMQDIREVLPVWMQYGL